MIICCRVLCNRCCISTFKRFVCGLLEGFRYGGKSFKGLFNGMINDVVDIHGVFKAHLKLCGMNVNVHEIFFDIEEKNGEGIFVLHQERRVGVLYCLGNGLVTYVATVDKVVLIRPVCTRHNRSGNKTAYFERSFSALDRDQILAHLTSIH